MKYFEIIGHIKTFFVENDELAIESLQNKEELEELTRDSERIIDDFYNSKYKKEIESAPRRMRVRKDSFYSSEHSDFIKRMNEKLLNECSENSSIIVEDMQKRTIRFLFKTNEVDNYKNAIRNVCKKITKVVSENREYLLMQLSGKREYFFTIDFETKEVSLKTFYFDGMMIAQNNGLDVSDFMSRINEKTLFFDGIYRYERIDNYLMEYDIPKKLTKEEFELEYHTLMMNKSFKEEIERIYLANSDYQVRINPVHYEFSAYDLKERIEMAKALATALYSKGRIRNKRFIKMDIDIMNSYLSNELVYMILKNSADSFVFIDFSIDKDRRRWDSDIYYGRSNIRTNELTDNILSLKDSVQFAFYVDKYQDRVRDKIYDELNTLNIVKFDNKIAPEKAMDFVTSLAKDANIEVDNKLISMVEMSKNDMTIKDAKDIFDNYKDELVKNKYFPEYKNYFEGRGNVDNYVDSYDALMAMPGLKNVKKLVDNVINFNRIESYKREHFMEYKDKDAILSSRYNGNNVSMNMIFMGNPGTCKTTVAKMIAKIFKSRGIIKNDRTEVFSCEGRVFNLSTAFKCAYGGVLFIDEAYSLPNTAITELVALMENHRNDVMVILAGYTKQMNRFLKLNAGLKSRFKYKVEFEDYTIDELYEILEYQVKERHYVLGNKVKEKVIPIFEIAQVDKELGNGRLCRNLLDLAIMNQNERLKDIDLESGNFDLKDINCLEASDFDIDVKELTGKAPKKLEGNTDPEIELDKMIAINNIKSMIEKCIASAEMNKIRRERKKDKSDNKKIQEESLIGNAIHLAFLGNPGTAKTTVARLFARILKKRGVIKRDDVVEVGRKDLVAEYVGQTAPLVKSVFESAKGGVLFIDEAYSLVDDRRGLFGDEAINTIIQEMENMRDEVIVIFAGYTERMKEFIARNEGLRSRLSFVLEFDDYNSEELYRIFEKMISDRKIFVTKQVKEYTKNLFEEMSKGKDFGNGRYVRKLIENAILNQNLRLSKKKNKKYTDKELSTLTIEDFKEIENDKILDKKDANAIGFAA